MHEISVLRDLLIIAGSAVLVVTLLRRIGFPSIAGFILTGVLTGPSAFGLVQDTQQVETLSEIGVVLLLFGIGLGLSLENLRRLWKMVLLGGGVQMLATILVGASVAYALGLPFGAAVFVGCIVAVSSTAVVLRGLAARGELNAPHGRLAVGVLVFQDLSVVPIMLAIPFLSGQGGTTEEVMYAVGIAALVLAGVVVASNVLVPRVLAVIANTRERDLFILTVFLVCFGTAWLVSLAGISLALSAFLAGLVVASSEYRHQALSDLIPTREVFASLFFVSVGMLLDVSDIVTHLAPICSILVSIVAGKFIIILGTALVLKMPLRVAILSAAALCQVGEFSFVLLSAASDTGILAEAVSHNLLVAIILSLLLTPVAISLGPRIVSGTGRIPWLHRLLGADAPGVNMEDPHQDHVIVAGYGLAGRAVCSALKEAQVPYIVVDINPDNVRLAKENEGRAVLGDVAQPAIIEDLGGKNARLFVLCINDLRASERATKTIRQLAPSVPLIVRAQYELDRETLESAGASEVVTLEATAGTALVSTALNALRSVSKNRPASQFQLSKPCPVD